MQLKNALALAIVLAVSTAVVAEPYEVDYSKLAFYPDRWEAAGVDFGMLAWEGEHVVFLTKPGEYDAERMKAFVSVLDQGWQTQQELVGKSPQPLRQVNDKPTICALPKPGLSCGFGCGYVGATGIEVAAFYDRDWPAFLDDPDSFGHYYFYEMGRNSFVYGDRHSLFTTGYAVMVRYVCMDRVGLSDPEADVRETIERCEELYAASDIPFLDAFTNLGAGEKQNRLTDAQGRVVSPSDQPVMYATAMLKLRKDYGGDAWLERFLHKLHECEPHRATDAASAAPQCFNWLVCASAAAGEDLSGVFADRWRLPMTAEQRDVMRRTDWSDPTTSVAEVVRELLAE